MKTRLFLLLLGCALASCSKRKAAEPPKPGAVASGAASSAAETTSSRPAASVTSPALPDPKWANAPTAWTDARVIDELANDCAFVPPPPAGESEYRPADLFRCTVGYEQACAFDPCWEASQRCKSDDCGRTCGTCNGTCTDSCQACKAGCSDAACKKACATTCASCKEDCNRTMDRCGSGTCTKVAMTCGKKILATHSANHCAAACRAIDACSKKCDLGSSDGDCYERCRQKSDAKYTTCIEACGNAGGECPLDCLLSSGCSMALCSAVH